MPGKKKKIYAINAIAMPQTTPSEVPKSTKSIHPGWKPSNIVSNKEQGSNSGQIIFNIPLRQPCIISSLPCLFEVIKMTSAPKLSYVSFRSCTVSGRPPRFFESQRIILSGSMLLWIRPEMVGPNVFSWSEPIQMRNLEAGQKLIKQVDESGEDSLVALPVWILNASWECRSNTGSSADADALLEHGRCVPNSR